MQKRRVVILGSTGSIGTSALKVARDIPDRMEIVGLAAGTSVEALAPPRRANSTCAAYASLTRPERTSWRARSPARRWKREKKGCAAWRSSGGGHGVNLHRGNRRSQTRAGRY